MHDTDLTVPKESSAIQESPSVAQKSLIEDTDIFNVSTAARVSTEQPSTGSSEDSGPLPWPRLNLGLWQKPGIPDLEGEQQSAVVASEQRLTYERNKKLPVAFKVLKQDDSRSQWCDERFGLQYLYDLRDYHLNYCEAENPSRFTCFHSRTDASGILDQMCIAQGATFSAEHGLFFMNCDWRNLTSTEWDEGVPMIGEFRNYWFETGPITVMNQTLATDPEVYGWRHRKASGNKKHTILLKREHMTHHIFHTFMQMLSLSMTFDVLRMTRDPQTLRPFLEDDHLENMQIAILDDHDEGPFYELWSMFTSHPLIRYSDLAADDMEEQNFIIPLTGGGNPFWHGDWIVHACEHSELLAAFRHTILEFYNMTDERRDARTPLHVTLIDRKGNRHLLEEGHLVTALKSRFPNVTVSLVDFEPLSLREQISIARRTDILVGVHGAGLTHSLFTPPGSALVELSPTRLDFKGFRSLANLAGNEYYAIHVTNNKTLDTHEDWHFNDVEIQQERFLDVMGLAIRTMYNKGFLSKDVDL